MRADTPARSTWSTSRGAFPHPPHTARPDGLAAVYRRREARATPLYPIVQHHLESFPAAAAAADPRGEGVPRWVEADFRAYLHCGILAHGFARIRCDACAAVRLVAFSSKGRGVCASCSTRRMVKVATHLTDHVLPPLPLRQWVLSLPKRIRPFLPSDQHLARLFLHCRYPPCTAAVALGNWGSEEAVSVLIGALADAEPLVRGHAGRGVGPNRIRRRAFGAVTSVFAGE